MVLVPSAWLSELETKVIMLSPLCAKSPTQSSQALEKIIEASPDIILTSSPYFFMIFFILVKGREWSPVLPDIPPHSNPEYAPACFIDTLSCSISLKFQCYIHHFH
ncbi:hypothetical protein V8G54_010195 [Vigna mungo]|uniref:Uncharacterized protein n=1 Tax=Vigna mungo TaxID=3915 RepID=A0AAQ3NZK8_VIGMU